MLSLNTNNKTDSNIINSEEEKAGFIMKICKIISTICVIAILIAGLGLLTGCDTIDNNSTNVSVESSKKSSKSKGKSEMMSGDSYVGEPSSDSWKKNDDKTDDSNPEDEKYPSGNEHLLPGTEGLNGDTDLVRQIEIVDEYGNTTRKYQYEYNENDDLLNSFQYVDNGDGRCSTLAVYRGYEYDENNRLTRVYETSYDYDNNATDYTYYYNYNEWGYIEDISKNTSRGREFLFLFGYQAAGEKFKIKSGEEIWDNVLDMYFNGNGTCAYFHFGLEGEIVSCELYESSSNLTDMPIMAIDYECDKKGRITSKYCTDLWSGFGSYHTSTKFGKNGIEVETYYYNNPEAGAMSETKYEYDGNGRLSEKKTQDYEVGGSYVEYYSYY